MFDRYVMCYVIKCVRRACVCKRDYFSIISYFSLAVPSGAFKIHLKVSMEKKKKEKKTYTQF